MKDIELFPPGVLSKECLDFHLKNALELFHTRDKESLAFAEDVHVILDFFFVDRPYFHAILNGDHDGYTDYVVNVGFEHIHNLRYMLENKGFITIFANDSPKETNRRQFQCVDISQLPQPVFDFSLKRGELKSTIIGIHNNLS